MHARETCVDILIFLILISLNQTGREWVSVLWGLSLNTTLMCLRKRLQKVVFILKILCNSSLTQILWILAAIGSYYRQLYHLFKFLYRSSALFLRFRNKFSLWKLFLQNYFTFIFLCSSTMKILKFFLNWILCSLKYKFGLGNHFHKSKKWPKIQRKHDTERR